MTDVHLDDILLFPHIRRVLRIDETCSASSFPTTLVLLPYFRCFRDASVLESDSPAFVVRLREGARDDARNVCGVPNKQIASSYSLQPPPYETSKRRGCTQPRSLSNHDSQLSGLRSHGSVHSKAARFRRLRLCAPQRQPRTRQTGQTNCLW
jgi:hypothetical protein